MLFSQLAPLTRLEICRPPTWSGRHLKGRDALSLSCLTHLKELSIEEPPVTVFLHLAGISTLTRLECEHWEDEIVGLSQLRRLEITSCKEDAFEGVAVSNLSKLVSLRLGVTQGGDHSLNITKLQKLSALTELHLTYGELYMWNSTLRQLLTLDRLQRLHISNPQCGRLTSAMIETVVSMQQLVSLEVALKIVMTFHPDRFLGLQGMPCLEYMSWTCSEGTFPGALHSLARTMRKKDKLKGYMIEDSSGVYVV